MKIVILALILVIAGCSDNSSDREVPGTVNTRATVHFDQFGILSADCDTDETCAEVLGYYHARDRFVQMDFRRRFTTGRLTDILNPELLPLTKSIALPVAISNRGLFMTRDGLPLEQLLIDSATPKTKALLEAYADGVNRWIGDVKEGKNGAKFPREFGDATLQVLKYDVQDIPLWETTDSAATILALINNLTNREAIETFFAQARIALGDDNKFQDLYSTRPINDATILEAGTYSTFNPAGSGAGANLMPLPDTDKDASKRKLFPPIPDKETFAVIRRAQEHHQKVAEVGGWLNVLDKQMTTGSNAWVVSPNVAAGNNALLSNDPHLPLSQPSLWYPAHLDAKTNGTGSMHTAGVTFAGMPWVILGQNERIAWGSTNSFYDTSDMYVEELVRDAEGEPFGVMYKGEVVEFTRVPLSFDFQDGTKETSEVLIVPHHGPVRGEIQPQDTTALTLRWTGHESDTDINLLTELAMASNLAEARVALKNTTAMAQNWMAIDSDGNIGWYPFTRVPARPWATSITGAASPVVPLDGNGNYEWGPYMPYEELPQITNPTKGYVATANGDMTGALADGDASNDGHNVLQSVTAGGYRQERILDLLSAGVPNHTRDTMETIVGDVYSLVGEDMTPKILEMVDNPATVLSENGQKVVNALRAWDFQCPTGLSGSDPINSVLSSDASEVVAAAGCAAFHGLMKALFQVMLADDGAIDGNPPAYALFYSVMDPTQLSAGDVYWDDISTTDVSESKFTTLAKGIDAAGDDLVSRLGADAAAWAWGRIHQLKLPSDLSQFNVTDFNNPPGGAPGYANDGGLVTVDVANPSGDYSYSGGASMRFVCESQIDAAPNCTLQLPGGLSSDIDSPSYDSLLEKYLANESIPLQMDIVEAAAEAAESIPYP